MKHTQKDSKKVNCFTKTNEQKDKSNQSNEQFIEITAIGSEIIEVVQRELNSVETQILLKNYMEILQTLQCEVITLLEKGKNQHQHIESLFNKNYDVITNYFIQCLQSFDNVKSSSIELLSNCLNQLFHILSNNINQQKQKVQQIKNDFGITTSDISKEENFVFLINSLSSAIKLLMKNFKIIFKDVFFSSKKSIEGLFLTKTNFNDLTLQFNILVMTKSTLKEINNNIKNITNQIDDVAQFNNELYKQVKTLDDCSVSFYDEAKKIFHKLKVLHNDRLANYQKISNELGSSSSLSNQPFLTEKKKHQSVSPSSKKINMNSTNNNKSQKQFEEVTTLYDTNFILNNQEKHSKSKEHYNQRRGQKKIPEKQIIITSPKIISNTQNGTSSNNILLTDLNESNPLQQEIKRLNQENAQLKTLISQFNQSFTISNTKNIAKRNLINLDNYNVNNINISSSLKDNVNNIDTPLLNTSGHVLANNILSFINNMKELQNSICQKNPNIVEMKKQFEKQKKELIHLATMTQLSSSSSTVNDFNSLQLKLFIKNKDQVQANLDKKTHSKEDKININKTREEYGNVIKDLEKQIKEKNDEIGKMPLELQKIQNSLDNNKRVSHQTKIKELENKNICYQNENEQLKTMLNSIQKEMNNKTNGEKQVFNENNTKMIDELTKEKEAMKIVMEETKNQNIKFNTSHKEALNQLKQANESINVQLKQCKVKKDLIQKQLLSANADISLKEQETIQLKQIQIDLEMENKEAINNLTQLQSELKEVKTINNTLKEDKDKLVNEIREIENQKNNHISETNSQNILLSKLKLEIMNNQQEITKIKQESAKHIEMDQKMISEYKTKLLKKENEVNELEKGLINLEKGNSNNLNSAMQKEEQSFFKQEFMETSQMLHKVKEMVQEKYNGLSIALTMNDLKNNQNDAFLFDEDNYTDKEEDEKEIENLCNNSSLQQLKMLKQRNSKDINSIDNIVTQVFNLIKSAFQIDDEENEEKNKKDNKEFKLRETADLNDKELNDKAPNELNNEFELLKSFFLECTNTIIESMKIIAPHMIEEEDELSFNLVSGSNIPLNLIDSKKNLSPTQSPLGHQSPHSSTFIFDQDKISTTINKFKTYNNEINQQFIKLQSQKEEFEKKAQSNLIKAQAYKSALDDAIAKINLNAQDSSVKYPGMQNSSGNIIKDQPKTFTFKDVDKATQQKIETNNTQDNLKHKDYFKMNSDLLLIQNDLLKKLEQQDTEQQKLQKVINNLLSLKETSNQQIQISEGKYKQLLQLYCNEQDKNAELKESYNNFLTNLTDNIIEAKEIDLPHPKTNDNKTKALSKSDENENEMEEEFEVEEMFKSKNNKQSALNKNKNATHQQIKHFNHNQDYLEMFNDLDKVSTHSANVQEGRFQELSNENKNHQEHEELIMTQLTAVKKELKETRGLVNHITTENNKLKDQLNQNILFQKDEIFGPLKNALERLIHELTFTPKIKEFITVILRIVGYNDEQILSIYQAKEKKKGFFNMFK